MAQKVIELTPAQQKKAEKIDALVAWFKQQRIREPDGKPYDAHLYDTDGLPKNEEPAPRIGVRKNQQ